MIALPATQAQTGKPFAFYGSMQLWARYTELNPGSTIGAREYPDALDFSLRRYRIGVKGRPYEKISYNLQLGNNNLSRYDKDQPPKVLDAYATYHFTGDHLLTVGKHAWTGLSRYAAPSTFSALGADIHYGATPGLNVHDDLFRRLAVAFRGKLQNVDYRLVLSKPFTYTAQPLSTQARFADQPTAMTFSGYLKYQFLDHESLGSAFSPASYLGDKELFTIGAGWTYQSVATQSLSAAGDTLDHPMRSFAVDLMYERPSGQNVWTLYLAYLNHDLGPDFVRYIGANNPANGGINNLTLNGRGNSFPEAGTGQVVVLQGAYLRKLDHRAVQPNVLVELAPFDALNDMMVLYEGGINYLLDGHRSKLSLTYQSRPIYTDRGEGPVVQERKGMMVLQYQLRVE